MQVNELGLPGVKLIVPDYFDDNRGYSAETYNHKVLEGYGILISLWWTMNVIMRRVGRFAGFISKIIRSRRQSWCGYFRERYWILL